MKLHIRYLERAVTEADLRRALEPYGEVASVTLVRNETAGEPIGLAIVEMPDADEAAFAASSLPRVRVHGSPLALDEARSGAGRRDGLERREKARGHRDRRTADRRMAARIGATLE